MDLLGDNEGWGKWENDESANNPFSANAQPFSESWTGDDVGQNPFQDPSNPFQAAGTGQDVVTPQPNDAYATDASNPFAADSNPFAGQQFGFEYEEKEDEADPMKAMNKFDQLRDDILQLDGICTKIRDVTRRYNKNINPKAYVSLYDEFSKLGDQAKVIKNALRGDFKTLGRENKEYENMEKDVVVDKSGKTEKKRVNKGGTVTAFRKNELKNCMTLFKEKMNAVSDAQEEYQAAVRAVVKRRTDIMMPNKLSEDDLDRCAEDPKVFNKLVQDQIGGINDDFLDTVIRLENKHRQVMTIAQEIQEIAEMFQELAKLVEEQGDVLENIELNVLQTRYYAEQANVELEMAKVYQDDARTTQWYIMICCAVILVIVVGGVIPI